MSAHHQFGRADLPPEQQQALKKAVRWEYATIGYTICTITLVAFVVGNSQAMRTAWIEDMLSLIPQVAFLIALLFVRRRPTVRHPYGMHRAMGIGHLVAGVALLAVGLNLAFEAVSGLVAAEHPTIGSVNLFGQTVWLGWLMVSVMSVIVIGPLIYGRAKAKLAPVLHNKLLYADADMAKADWQTNAASIVGVLGVGFGAWWLDGVAALFISLGIVWDGVRNTKGAVIDLMDQRARTYDDEHPHPLAREVVEHLRAQPWIADAAVRMRDQGQVFHIEAFVVPRRGRVSVAQIDRVSESIAQMDWKVQDVVVIACSTLPDEADRGRARDVDAADA
ncbi:cation diffusion facilitator family transporter [Microbacterium sp.]|uniref:cation diffusion facilitator family transporter n=1 Tax=Microbacterium sp. TaxID=51671 RepID=UPI0027367F20|nr:cation diffusion facilitator family transporter [Microbacterium sp.]MDP3949989.1 cation diffusion facilitator family transporter [Microbacterium sp.]